ncbi:class I lanthipeptide [Kordia sp.]|uniref:class I lanthipeptide n=1 Tax=Kordia sp. TaxID=1965332 RepID=UPI003D6C5494
MKKKDLKGLSLNKKLISNLNEEQLKGGIRFTRGCTDGCTPIQTAWNCTRTNCSDDCGGGISLLGPCSDSGCQNN